MGRLKAQLELQGPPIWYLGLCFLAEGRDSPQGTH